MHIEQRHQAFSKVYDLLKPGGRFVCSLSIQDEWLDFGKWKLPLKLFNEKEDIQALQNVGLTIAGTQSIQENDELLSVIVCAEKGKVK